MYFSDARRPVWSATPCGFGWQASVVLQTFKLLAISNKTMEIRDKVVRQGNRSISFFGLQRLRQSNLLRTNVGMRFACSASVGAGTDISRPYPQSRSDKRSIAEDPKILHWPVEAADGLRHQSSRNPGRL